MLAEMLGRHRQTLQALQGLSEQLAQAERQWKKQLGSLGRTRPMGAWVSGPLGTHGPACRSGQDSSLRDWVPAPRGLPLSRKRREHST